MTYLLQLEWYLVEYPIFAAYGKDSLAIQKKNNRFIDWTKNSFPITLFEDYYSLYTQNGDNLSWWMMIGKIQGTLLVFCMPMFGLAITSKDVTHNGKIVQVIKVK